MNQVKKLVLLKGLSYFDKNSLSQVISQPTKSLYANINRWLQSGILIQLKKGLYVTADFVKSQKEQEAYTEFVANKLREPSYLSAEYVLQKYNILPEAVYGFTSVTLKSKRIYRNKFGVFVYRSIKKELFAGYDIQKINGFNIRVASKAKALFDYFYYKLYRVKEIDENLVRSFRLNYDNVSTSDLKEFKRYSLAAKTKKMNDLASVIRRLV